MSNQLYKVASVSRLFLFLLSNLGHSLNSSTYYLSYYLVKFHSLSLDNCIMRFNLVLALAGLVTTTPLSGNGPVIAVEERSIVKRSFASSCTNIHLNYPNILAADCLKANGQYHYTEVDLNYCLGIDEGYLRWEQK
jgi:hypothetical protein